MEVPQFKIAFHVSRDEFSGTYFRYHNLAIGLQKRGHEVVVYTQGIPAMDVCTEWRDGVRYEVLPGFPGNSYFDFAVNPGNILRRALHRIAPADIHHLFQPLANSAVPWLRLLRRRSGIRPLFVWDWDDLWCGGLIAQPPVSRWRRWQYQLLSRCEHDLARRADVVTTCSAYLADLAHRRGARCAEVVHNGFWPEASFHTCQEVRHHFGLRSENFYIGFIGWTPAEVDWSLEALGRLDGRVRLVSCGYDIRKNLGAFPDLACRVDYLGMLPASEAKKLMRALDAGLLPLANSPLNQSRLPIKFADYLSAGCPAICGRVGEVGTLGASLKGAILLPPEKRDWVYGCVEAVRQIQRDPASHLPDQHQLEALLAWPVLTERLECVYVGLFESRHEGSAKFE